MRIDYVPMLARMREFYRLPRTPERFKTFFQIALTADRQDIALPPFIALNPMAHDHVARLLDDYLALDADAIAARTAAELAPEFVDQPGRVTLGLTLLDGLHGGWTNRYAAEHDTRFGPAGNDGRGSAPRAGRRAPRPSQTAGWLVAPLWSSEPATAEQVRATIACALWRAQYVHRHGAARTLREKLAQEGWVLNAAHCPPGPLTAQELAHTRKTLAPLLDVPDLRTAVECLFGDAAALTLGFTPRGLPPNAGLALAQIDALATLPADTLADTHA